MKRVVQGNIFYLNKVLKAVDYAFQPIVNIHTGQSYGYEALIRHVDSAGFASIAAFFDHMHLEGFLGQVHQKLLEKAHRKFNQIPWADQVKLFFNLDGRLFCAACSPNGAGFELTSDHAIAKGKICLELSERHEICDPKHLIERLQQYRATGCRIAVDDFGTGFAGNHLLYCAKPEYIKIDRFYIDSIDSDAHKRMLAASMVNIAHLMGCIVIAEGVETEKEYYLCKALGCDLMQGYLVQRPELEIRNLQKTYAAVQQISDKDRRKPHTEDAFLLKAEIDYIEPINSNAEPIAMLDAFKKNKNATFFPVVNGENEALGIIREVTVKEYAYSEFGRYLLVNPSACKTIENFMHRIPIVEIHTPLQKILDTFATSDNLEGVIITNKLKYVGILRAQSLLRIINEKKLANAIDQNPLSNLPGNKLIYEYVSRALGDNNQTYMLIYFDFDNFKVYNDTYGFRQGDRVILLFAELLKARAHISRRFEGHIGGDDFFMGLEGLPLEAAVEEVKWIGAKFATSVESFYDTETIRKGCLMANDRDGESKCFPLMSISAAILELPAGSDRIYTPEEIGKIMAKMKKQAKRSADKFCVSTLNHFEKTDLNPLHEQNPAIDLLEQSIKRQSQ